MVGVFRHFVSGYAFKIKCVLLTLCWIESNHSREEVTTILIGIIKFWKVEDRLGVFVSDNSEVNDVIIEHILAELRPDIVNS